VLDAFDALTGATDFAPAALAGDIRFSAPVSFGAGRLAALLGDFMASHPGVRVDLVLSDMPLDLIEHRIDLALVAAWELPPSVIARRIGEERVGVFASPAYLRRRGTPKHPDELSRHDTLVCTGGGRKPWHFGHPVSGQRIEPPIEPRLVANSANALLAAAIQGAGLALLPHGMAQRAVDSGRLQPVLSHWSSPTLGIFLTYSSRHLQPRVRALIEHVAADFEERAFAATAQAHPHGALVE
jgi:DNA-binding transcriptional LysR family regulator